jgi:hypothetical protein
MVVHYMQFGLTACMKKGLPKDWEPGHQWSANWNEVNCEECLKGREIASTYTVTADNLSITCLRCKFTSKNPKDVEQHYCGRCHVFHDDLWPPARRWWVAHPDRTVSNY